MSKDKLPFVRNPYNYDMALVSQETGLACKDPSLAQQHMKDECDINVIVERFGVTGQLPVRAIEPSYGDFSGVSDYHTALNKIKAAEAEFMALPAKLRAKFDHDPNALLNFLENEANRDEAIELGLIDGEPVVRPIVSDVETPKPDA
nr:MAG: internal scaffolding protein [Microvirus sp.]